MQVAGSNERFSDALHGEAAAWLARLRRSSNPSDQAAFETWYIADPAHADAYDQALRGWDASTQTSAAMVRRSETSDRFIRRRRMTAVAAAAAALAAFAGIGVWGPGRVARGPSMPRDYASQVGELRAVTLSDGSLVTLDSNSLFHFASLPTQRLLVLERGRARFTVDADEPRPFVVRTGGATITARGSMFDVALFGSDVEVAALRGDVEVAVSRAVGAASGTDKLTVQAGQHVYTSQARVLSRPRPLAQAETRWVSGMLSFDNALLADVVLATNRYNARQIVLDDAAARQLRFTGTFRATNPVGLTQMLAAMFHLRLSQDRKGNLLLSSGDRRGGAGTP